MKIEKRIAAFLLAVVSLFAVSCGETEEQPQGDAAKVEYVSENGNHSFKIEKTEIPLVENGRTEYTVVLPENPTKFETLAAEELIFFFKEATGINLLCKADSEISHSKDSRYLYVGNVAQAQEVGVENVSGLGLSGFKLCTVDKSVYMLGGQYGSIYAVYEFLGRQFNYEYYGENCYSLMRNVKNNDLLSYEVTDIPDIQLYSEAFGIANLNATHKMRLGGTPDTVIMTPPGGAVHHNTLSYLPPDKYRDEHPKFYMEGEHQLCYTAHGDNAELEVMRELVYQKLISFLQDNLTSPSVEFTQMDVSVWCSCEACNALFQTYGTDAVGQILFINPVAERVQAWIDENQPGRSFTIVLFAYVNTQGAPVKKLADSTYAPIDNSVVCADNVGIFFAPISGDFTRSIEDDVNAAVKEQFVQWSLLTKNLYFWNYVVNFNNYFLPYDSFASIQGMFQRAAQSNTLFIFDQGHYDGQRTTAWSALKVYVHNKLRWDTCANMQELIENFFENYYGIASEEMLGLFNEMRVWMNYLKTEMDWAGGNSCLSSNLSNAEYWPRGVLQGWINEYDKIYEKLEVLKQDGVEEYEKYYYRVGLEAMSPKYMLVTLHTVYLSKDVLEKHVSELEFLIDTLQVDRVAEHKSSNGLREAIIG